jgi:hypothetical protein
MRKGSPPAQLPGIPDAVAVEHPQNPANEKQDGLVERSREGQESDRGGSPKRLWDLSVACDDSRGANHPSDRLHLGTLAGHQSALPTLAPSATAATPAAVLPSAFAKARAV